MSYILSSLGPFWFCFDFLNQPRISLYLCKLYWTVDWIWLSSLDILWFCCLGHVGLYTVSLPLSAFHVFVAPGSPSRSSLTSLLYYWRHLSPSCYSGLLLLRGSNRWWWPDMTFFHRGLKCPGFAALEDLLFAWDLDVACCREKAGML